MIRGTFFDKIFSLIYPDTCPYCGKIIGNTDLKCNECEKIIKYSFSVREISDTVKCVSPFLYDGKVRDAVHRFKFRGYKRYAWNFAFEVAKAIDIKFPMYKFSAVVPVPIYKSRKKDRGYNQAGELAKELGKILNIPSMEVLEKTKNTSPQYKIKDYEEKIRNVKGVYKVTCSCQNPQERILVCDDIVTSGGTLAECVKALKLAGFKNISCATISNAQR